MSLRLEGLPPGVKPYSNISGGVSLIQGGWSITLDAIPGLKIPALANYAGQNPYSECA